MSSIGEKLYDSSASLGQFTSKLWLYIGIIVACILFIVGIYLFTTDQSYLVDSIGEVTDSRCDMISDKTTNTNTFNCTVDVKYKINNNIMNSKMNTTEMSPIIKGSSIDITYDVRQPTKITRRIVRNKSISLAMSIISVILILIVWLNYYISQNYKIYASAQGANTILSIISAPFHG